MSDAVFRRPFGAQARGRRSPRLGLSVLGLLAASSSVLAEPVHEAPLDIEGQARFKDIGAMLGSGELEATRTGIVRLRAETHSAYVGLLVSTLARGGSEPVVVEALGLAEQWAKPALSPAVAPYLKHRNPRIRMAAGKALSKTGGPEAVKALRSCLRSSDGPLREVCVVGLGEAGDPIAVGDLLTMLDRGVGAAALAVGRLCDDAGCGKLADRLTRVPFEALGPGLVEVLARTDARVSSATRVELVARIGNLRTPQAAALLRGAKTRFTAKADRAVVNAVDAALDTFGGK